MTCLRRALAVFLSAIRDVVLREIWGLMGALAEEGKEWQRAK